MSSKKKLRSLLYVTLAGYGTFSAISIYKGDEKFYKNYVMPVIHLLDAERAHNFAVLASKYRLFPKTRYEDPELLKVKIFGKEFSNPVGIAAGFDKDGKAILGLRDIGFGFVEVGSVTPEPQPGNEQPRVFRLLKDYAVINRYGFNSEGHSEVLKRIENVRQDAQESNIIGVNLGKNKSSTDPINDYIEGIIKFGPLADYLVINISSPNTPGLRNMQHKEQLKKLLAVLIETRNNLPLKEKPPLLLKLAPDLSYAEKKDIADVLNQKKCRVDGLIISNTTVERPDSLKSVETKNETGGLSGEPLKDMSTRMIADMSKLTGGLPIIGVGGISSGQDAYEKIKAGASLVQLYTALVYEGPPIVAKVKKELVELLSKDGYSNVCQAVGKGNK
ncbi:dihydroorotate dehydrogenase (quinone), mitochondrial [Anoplophora glabripennis]|uniref:dihydroorotate dehydrogenase (quinone), mitochondrial n=1 Tax=Anoplophora glabripennis TaxID=217634 RepID=UPI000873C519|nr:dihydroorotate dehydrogenase (quinone), mitochondrial [Anoplophora glabripennis]